jgi:hypothetical protein
MNRDFSNTGLILSALRLILEIITFSLKMRYMYTKRSHVSTIKDLRIIFGREFLKIIHCRYMQMAPVDQNGSILCAVDPYEVLSPGMGFILYSTHISGSSLLISGFIPYNSLIIHRTNKQTNNVLQYLLMIFICILLVCDIRSCIHIHAKQTNSVYSRLLLLS